MKRHQTQNADAARGVALITTLVLLALLSAASLAMVMMVSSDTLINGYYGNYRGSFYAADSGANVVVGNLQNAIVGAAATLAPGSVAAPLPVNAAPNVAGNYAPYQASYYTIGDPGSWTGNFTLIPNADGKPVVGTPITNAPIVNGQPTPPGCPTDCQWSYVYPYEVTVRGQSTGNEDEEINETGYITYNVSPGSIGAGGPPSFAKWGAFIDQFGDCQGPLVQGTMTGPFFTNGQWNFANSSNPGYTFTDSVGQSTRNVSWWNNSNCSDSSSAPRGFNKPNFENGLQLNQNPVTPPSNSYNQAKAVLDGKGIPPCSSAPCPTDTPPTQSQMNQELKTVNGTSYPSSGSIPNGVYVPWYTSGGRSYFGSNQSGSQMPAGGFYVQGDASITLSATTGGDGTSNPTQTYTITQGSGFSRTTTTIVVDPMNGSTGTTTISSGGTTQSLQGVPQQLDPNTGNPIIENDPSGNPMSPALVYVNGQITGMSGTIQNDAAITVTAADDISITGDLTYKQQPVSVPADVLNSSTDAGVLGIYTNNNINLYPNSSGSNRGNLTVDASLAAIGGGNSGFETPGNSIGTWTIVGGRSEDHAHGVNINRGNTYYDRRFGTGTFGPPWFPTAIPQPGSTATPPTSGINFVRTWWSESKR